MVCNNRDERVLHYAEWSLVAIGVAMIALAAAGYLEAAQQHAGLKSTLPVDSASSQLEGAVTPARFPWNLTIRRLGVSVAVLEGTYERTLAYAAGHILGTRRPGQPGTIGIAAHRDTFFRPLRGIRVGDLVQVGTPYGRFDYRVESTVVVEPEDTRLLRSNDDTLVLVTCFPFNFVGAAPKRFLVRCLPVPRADVLSSVPAVT